MNPQTELARISALLRERKLAAAEAACRALLARVPEHSTGMHLLGLIRKDLGDAVEGERLLLRSIELEPGNAEYRLNFGNLLRRAGRLEEAQHSYREVLALNPNHRGARLGLARTLNDQRQYAAAEAECRALLAANADDVEGWSALAMTLRDRQRYAEAEAAYRRALDIDPHYAPALHNLGSVLASVDRPEESLQALEGAQRLGLQGFELEFNRGRALLQLYRIDEAEQAFERAVAQNPMHLDAQSNLARIRFMRGDPEFARAIETALEAHSQHTQMRLLLALVLRRSGDLRRAEAVLRTQLQRDADCVDALWALAETLLESQQLAQAEPLAHRAVELQPGNVRACETLVTILLARDHPEAATAFIAERRRAQPLDQRWIAYEATAARLLGDAKYRWLYDYDRLVRSYDLQIPGWPSMQSFNDELLALLSAKHTWAAHPLDQSLRHGSQTTRNLLTDPHPLLRAAFAAFSEAIAEYRRHIGTDPSHPLLARNHGNVSIHAAWSVQLREAGFHVNHVHPQGWISSAYYVEVPPQTEDEAAKFGWLKFGEPRFASRNTPAEKFLQPRAGRLVLFPSYMWHGTNAIHGHARRTSIAFDAIPTDLTERA